MSAENILLSPISRLPSGLRNIHFYSAETGFGSIREGYTGLDSSFCTIVEFPDLEGVSREDTNHTALSLEGAPTIIQEAVELVLPHAETSVH